MSNLMNRKRTDIPRTFLWILVIFLTVLPCVSALSFFEEGEKLFLENKPMEALVMLEAALAEKSSNEKIYLYLGIIYEQLGQHEKAVSILELGLPVAVTEKVKYFFNLGNNYFMLGNMEKADEMYSKAIETNAGFSAAYLNRANTRMREEEFRDAVSDYIRYITLRPSAPQKKEIEQIISLLTSRIAEEERMKAEEERGRLEEQRRQEEAERLEAEAEQKRIEEVKQRQEEERKRIEEERRKQEELLNQVLNSLENVQDDTTSRSAGSETIEDYEEDLDISD